MNVLDKLARNGITLTYEDIVRLCVKYHITKMSIFGSVLRDDFSNRSDVDILVSYENYKENNNPFDFLYIEDDFEQLLNREVDVVDIDELTNPIRRKKILSTCEVVYAVQ